MPREWSSRTFEETSELCSESYIEFSSKFDNVLTPASTAIEKYKKSKEKGISLDTREVDPINNVNLKEDIKRAKIIKILSIGNKSPVKIALQRTKSVNNVLKTKPQSVTIQSQRDIDSEDKDYLSRQSGNSSCYKKISWEARVKKGQSESKLIKNLSQNHELAVNRDYLTHPLTSIEPKDVSDRTLAAFEGYLSNVSSMYFSYNTDQQNKTLNEVSSRLWNNNSGLLMDSSQKQFADASSSTEGGCNLVSNDFHYSTLDVLSNPLRMPHVFENWSPREIAIFEAWIWKFGKKFEVFPKFIKSKSTHEVIEFYYCWKSTSHFKGWQQNYDSEDSEDLNDWIFK